MRNIVEAIITLRELQGIKQSEIAVKLGISRSALNQFEKKKATLSKENILALAEILNLNSDWIANKSDVLLKGNDVIFMKAKHSQIFQKFMFYAKNVEYLCIFKPDTTLKYFVSKIVRESIFVIAVRFKNDTYCIINVDNFIKSVNDFYVYFESMFEKLSFVGIKASYVILEEFENKKEILKKIEEKTIMKEEIKNLYEIANTLNVNLSLSGEEKHLILWLRKNDIPISEVYKCIKEKYSF